MNFGVREWRQLQRMRPDQQASLLESKAIALTFLASLLLLGAGTVSAPNVCTHGVFSMPIVSIGIFLMVIFILGLCGKRHNNDDHYRTYFAGLLVTILVLLGFVIFGYVAVGGIDIGPIRVREYNLEDYSGWLKGRTVDPYYWAKTSECLHDGDVCRGMTQLVRDPNNGIFVPELSSFEKWAKEHGLNKYVHVMSPIESGCCKPPSSCGFTYVNGTTWTPTTAAAVETDDDDCSRWSNDQQKLCYKCDSCKAGFLDITKKGWNATAFVLIFALMGLIFASCPGIQYCA